MRCFDRGEIYFFECDQRGRNSNYDGYPNSNGGTERPFILLSNKKWNIQCKNEDIYAVPLTGGGVGNAFSITLSEEHLKDRSDFLNLRGSIILCDKICRICEKDIFKKNTKKIAELELHYCSQIRNNLIKFLKEKL